MARQSIFEHVMRRLHDSVAATIVAWAACVAPAWATDPFDWTPGAPGFRWVEVVTIPGHLPSGEPWSPVGSILAISSATEPRSVQAIDASAKDPTPWHLFDATVLSLDWSPDGAWVVAVVQDSAQAGGATGGEPAPDRSLIACSAARDLRPRDVHALAAGYGEVRVIWGVDGRIWYRPVNRVANWRVTDPPEVWRASWRRPDSTSGSKRTTLLTLIAPWAGAENATCIAAVETGDGWPTESVVPVLRPNDGSTWLVDAYPDGSRVLAGIAPNEGHNRIVVIDGKSHVYARFTQALESVPSEDGARVDRSTFEPCTVSSDGMTLIGTRRIEDAKGITTSVLCIADSEGRWVAPIEGAPPGVEPRAATVGTWVAYHDFREPLVHVGRVERIED